MAVTITTSQTASTLPQKKGDPPNLGTVKSGRALAFDGVVDYLTHTATDAFEEFTVAVWINVDAISGRQNISHGSGAGEYLSINVGATDKYDLQMYTGDIALGDGGWLQGGIVLNIDTWYRVVFIFKKNSSAGDYKTYVNGVEDTTGHFPFEGDGDYTNGTFLRVGSQGGTSRFFNGMMSNYQVWNTSWTLADVQYDYTHPEMLAHTRGDSSLIESNLKLWYPMTEGNPESPQTTIFDGSPKGLGSEILANPNFDEDSDWSKYGTPTATINNGIATLPDGSSYITQTVLTVGKVYYYAIVARGITGDGDLNIADGDTTHDQYSDIPTTNATYSGYFTARGTLFTLSESGVGGVYVDSASVKEVRRGNHATSVFYGDEMVSEGDFSGADDDDPWVTNAGWAIASNKATCSANNNTLTQAISPVAGKTYRVSVDVTLTSGELYIKVGNASIQTTTSSGVQTFDFVASNTDALIFYGGAFRGYLEDVSVKEVGLSTTGHVEGQETIFQPAFVRQSRKIAFDGVDDYVSISDNASLDFGSSDDFSINIWANLANDHVINYASFVKKASERQYNTFTGYNLALFGSGITQGASYIKAYISDGSTKVSADATQTLSNYSGWNMITMVVNRSNDILYLYINGMLEDSSDISAVGDLSNGNNLEFGRDNKYERGTLDEVAILDEALTLSQIQELYNNGVPFDLVNNSLTSSPTLNGYWRNNVLHTDGTWKDLSTNSNNGTLSGGSTVIFPEGTTSGRDINGFFLTHSNKNYLSLDGVKTHVDIPYSPVFDMGTGDFSIEGWIKTEVASDYQQVIWLGDTAESIRFYLASNGTGTFKIDEGSSDDELTTTVSTWDDNIWTHFVCVCDRANAKLKIYKDAELIAQDDINTTDITASETLNSPTGILIGKHWSDYGTNFKGFIDDVRVYNRVLTDGGLSLGDSANITSGNTAGGEIRKNYRHGSGKHKD